MKHFYKVLILFIILQINVFATNQGEAVKNIENKSQKEISISEKSISPIDFNLTTNNYWGVFWINFLIAAIGVYTIYGFAAGIVSAGISYFVVNGDKKGFRMAIFGASVGVIVGLVALLLRLSVI